VPRRVKASAEKTRSTRKRGPQARGIATRARMLEAARELFSRHGYAAVSRADVARRAGCGMGTAYYHFPDKRVLLLELIDEWGRAMPVQRRAAFDVKLALQGQIRRAAREFLRKSHEHLRKRPSFYRVMVSEAARDPEVRRRHDAAHRGITSWMVELMRLAQQSGVVRTQRKVDAAAYLVHHVIESTLAELGGETTSGISPDDVLDELAEMLCWYLMGDPRSG
jgi:AcrR family transcriptional regulator